MAATITHFSLPQLPDETIIISLIDGVPVIPGQLYPIADQNLLTFERIAKYNDLSVSKRFQFQVHDTVNNLSSNISGIFIKWIGVSLNPESSDLVEEIFNDDSFTLLEKLPLNDSVEILEINTLVGLSENMKYNGYPVYENQTLDITQLDKTVFTAESNGGGDPYFEMTYYVGKNGTINKSTGYKCRFNLNSLATTSILTGPDLTVYTDTFDVLGTPTEYTVKDEKYIIEILNGYVFGTAEIEIVINSDFLALNTWNFVEINGVEYSSNQTLNLSLNLDKYGKAELIIINSIIFDTGDPKNGDITITLNSINANPLLVDSPQTEQLITNL